MGLEQGQWVEKLAYGGILTKRSEVMAIEFPVPRGKDQSSTKQASMKLAWKRKNTNYGHMQVSKGIWRFQSLHFFFFVQLMVMLEWWPLVDSASAYILQFLELE